MPISRTSRDYAPPAGPSGGGSRLPAGGWTPGPGQSGGIMPPGGLRPAGPPAPPSTGGMPPSWRTQPGIMPPGGLRSPFAGPSPMAPGAPGAPGPMAPGAPGPMAPGAISYASGRGAPSAPDAPMDMGAFLKQLLAAQSGAATGPSGGPSGGPTDTSTDSAPGHGTDYPGGFPGVPGTSGTSDTGYPVYRGKEKGRNRLTKWQKRAKNNMPPWMQDPTMFREAMGSINEILGRHGKMSPDKLIAEQADIESGRGQSMDAIRARLAQAGVDPTDPAYSEMLAGADQRANRAQVTNRRQNDLQSEQQWRQDLQLVTPYLQAILGMTGPKGAGGVTAAPVGGGGGGTDWAGMLSSAGNSFLSGYGQGLGGRS